MGGIESETWILLVSVEGGRAGAKIRVGLVLAPVLQIGVRVRRRQDLALLRVSS